MSNAKRHQAVEENLTIEEVSHALVMAMYDNPGKMSLIIDALIGQSMVGVMYKTLQSMIDRMGDALKFQREAEMQENLRQLMELTK